MFDVDYFTRIYESLDKNISKDEAIDILNKDEINEEDF